MTCLSDVTRVSVSEGRSLGVGMLMLVDATVRVLVVLPVVVAVVPGVAVVPVVVRLPVVAGAGIRVQFALSGVTRVPYLPGDPMSPRR